MTNLEKETLIKGYLRPLHKGESKAISRLELHKLKWLIARDRTKNLSFIEYVGLSDFIDELWSQRRILL